jgi:hypothetical protein
MKVRKTIYIIVLALASVALTAAAGPIIIMVNGVGQANDPDRNASYQAADQDARQYGFALSWDNHIFTPGYIGVPQQ